MIAPAVVGYGVAQSLWTDFAAGQRLRGTAWGLPWGDLDRIGDGDTIHAATGSEEFALEI